jgi:hypothetical protein
MKTYLNGSVFSSVFVGVVATNLLVAFNARSVPSIVPTGTTIYDPQKAYNSYVLFSGGDEKTHLIDLDGNEVHRWNHDGFPSVLIDPQLVGG